MLTLYTQRFVTAWAALEEKKKKKKEDRLTVKDGISVLKGNKTQAQFSVLSPLL